MGSFHKFKIFLGGDVYSGEYKIQLNKDLSRLLSNTKFGCINLEGPILEKKGLAHMQPNLPIYSSPKIISFFQQAHINLVSLANNHISDWGYDALCTTLDTLDELSIKYFGAGLTAKEAGKPIILCIGDTKVGFLSYGEEKINCFRATLTTFGCNPMLPELIKGQITLLKEKGIDIIIIQIHCGLTNYSFPLPAIRKLFRHIIEWGADVVVGHHPHVIQGVEQYKDGYIAYSLGNLVFVPILRQKGWMNLTDENCYSMIMIIEVYGRAIKNIKLYHTFFDFKRCTLKLLDKNSQKQRDKYLLKLSTPLNHFQNKYESFYNRYWYVRMFKRSLWRLHPKRIKELSLTHLKAVWISKFLR